MHERETGQFFSGEVKEKLWDITAGQPGLVNGFANGLVKRNNGIKNISIHSYYDVEDWYLYDAKASLYITLMENLLSKEENIQFDIDKEPIKFLHTQGVIKKAEDKSIKFWVPLHKKRLYKYSSPDLNGESKYFFKNEDPYSLFKEGTEEIRTTDLIQLFKEYIAERTFKYFIKRSDDGTYNSLPEAAAGYAFTTYIDCFIRKTQGKIYFETNSGLGYTNMIVSTKENDYIMEFEVFSDKNKHDTGKKQVAYYAKKRKLNEAYYVVFVSNRYKHLAYLKEKKEDANGTNVNVFLIWYDEVKDFWHPLQQSI